MRVELIEKAVTGLSAVAILLVAACVAFFSFVNKSSGLEPAIVNSLIDTDKWLDDQRALARGENPANKVLFVSPKEAPQPTAAVATAPGEAGKQAPAVTSRQEEHYIDEPDRIPPNEQVPGVPWLRRQPGVVYMKPEGVSQVVAQKYQSFDDAWQLAQEGGGEFVQTDKGAAYRINWIDPNSNLTRMVGLQQGDQVVSVNGHPIGNSFAAGKQLYDQLKGEHRFAVKIIRGGQEMVLPYYVK